MFLKIISVAYVKKQPVSMLSLAFSLSMAVQHHRAPRMTLDSVIWPNSHLPKSVSAKQKNPAVRL